ncbi:hypothetical protein GCM10009780_22720 [Actinomadura alba]
MDAADETGLPGDPEFRAAFAGYIEWGTRLALANSRPGAHPVRHAPVPRWGWGVATSKASELRPLDITACLSNIRAIDYDCSRSCDHSG